MTAELAGVERLERLAKPAAEQSAKNEAVIRLLEQWMADESGYDERTWPIVKRAIEENRLSYRKRFSD